MKTLEKISISSVRLSESIGEELMKMIASGSLEPGQRLNEVHLASMFGVSRGPVREAAKELEGQGMLISRPRQGFYVMNYTPKEISDLYITKQWLDRAMVDDFRTNGDLKLYREIQADIATIDSSTKLEFANSLLAFRTRMTARLSNRFLAGQILSLYRHLYIVSALLHTDHTERRIEQIMTTLKNFWAEMVGGDFDAALKVLHEDTEYWHQDVVPRFFK
tara:strand:+ start:37336 stop:37995 length:660 start_codon:yes stop_codon:yes gene_type:complete